MDRRVALRRALLGCLALASVNGGVITYAQTALPRHTFFHVALDSAFSRPTSGRLLLFVKPAGQQVESANVASVDMDMMAPASVYIAAREVSALKPGATVDIDADDLVFPNPVSQAPAGVYQVQAVLDIDHSYNYTGRAAGDIESAVSTVSLPLRAEDAASLTLIRTVPNLPDPLATRADVQAALQPIDYKSPALSRFWGRDIHMRGWVLLPPDYAKHRTEHYPTVYFTHGFGGTMLSLRSRSTVLYDRMKAGRMPPMIWVLLDESSPTGTHEFADSVNNGPWGTALTTELIPKLEASYRMDARTSGRFLQGHSSGGWATLWLQTRYPKIFGGTWSTSPDPSDFHRFSTIDLYAPQANFYRNAAGELHPMIRIDGKPRATMKQLAQLEAVLGPYGGQLASFEWVFSPRGKDGRPAQLFDRITGDIDPSVAAYWQGHYDISAYLMKEWKIVGLDVRGKIHLFVGTDDTFYLDGAAHELQATLDRLHGDGHFTFVPGRSHFNLYMVGDDRYALFDTIGAQMQCVARPRSKDCAGPVKRLQATRSTH